MEKKIQKPPGLITEYQMAFYLKTKCRHLNLNNLLQDTFCKKEATFLQKLKLKQ